MMRTLVQVLLGMALAVLFICLGVEASRTQTITVVSNDTRSLQNGDILTFSEPITASLEAQSDYDFTFLAGDTVLRGEPFASGRILKAEFASEDLRLVEGDADIKISSSEGVPFDYIYDPGPATIKTVIIGCLILWLFTTFIGCFLVALIIPEY